MSDFTERFSGTYFIAIISVVSVVALRRVPLWFESKAGVKVGAGPGSGTPPATSGRRPAGVPQPLRW